MTAEVPISGYSKLLSPSSPFQRERKKGEGFILIFLFVFCCETFAQEKIQLMEAVNYALAQNRELATLKLAIESSLLDVNAAQVPFQYKWSPDGRVGRTEDGREARYGLAANKKTAYGTELEVGARFTDQQNEDADDLQTMSLRAEVRQPLLKNAGKLVNLEPVARAKSRVFSAQRTLELKKTDLVVEVVETYESLIRLQRQVDFDEQSYERFDRLYRLTKARESQGRTTRIDTLRAEFRRGQAELTRSTTLKQLETTKRDFADLMGFPPQNEFEAVAEPVLELEMPSIVEAVLIAQSNRLDYAQTLHDLRDAERGVSVAEYNVRPDVQAVFRYERLGDGVDFSEASSLDDEIWFVGLSGDTDFHRRLEKISLGQASLDRATAEKRVEILEASLQRQVQQALVDYEQAVKQVTFAEKNHKLAQDRATLARRLFDMGRSDNFTVTDAETELLQAESQMLATRAESSIAGYKLLRVLGTLIESPEMLKPKT